MTSLKAVTGLCIIFSLKYVDNQLWSSRSLTGGAITSNGLECAEIGAYIFKLNGSVADATIATLFCEGISCPQSMGLGGGFLLTIYTRENKHVETLDARETAPAAAYQNMYSNQPQSAVEGGLSIAVPGELKGYWTLHQKYGKLKWKSLLEPAINLCKEGHIVTGYLERIIAPRRDKIYNVPSLREIFIDPATRNTWKEGDRIKRLALAESLEIIAEEGVNALYGKTGTLLPKLMKDLRLFNSILTEEDFYNYEPRWLEPAYTSLLQNYNVFSMPLPGSGHILTYMLNIFDSFPEYHRNDPLTWHRIVECFKHGYGLRSQLGDPAFVEGIENELRKITSKTYASTIRESIQNNITHSDYQHYGAQFLTVEDYGTAHVSVLAPNGDAISVTSTINYILGAMVRSTATGIILNDEMDDFSLPGFVNTYGLRASPANYITAGKRPLSSMSPTIVTDKNGDVRIIVGSAGGSRITTATMLLILRHLYFDENLNDIINAKRLHHQLIPMSIEYERDFNKTLINELESRGHQTIEAALDAGFAAVTAIIRNRKNELHAAYDPRRSGNIFIVP